MFLHEQVFLAFKKLADWNCSVYTTYSKPSSCGWESSKASVTAGTEAETSEGSLWKFHHMLS